MGKEKVLEYISQIMEFMKENGLMIKEMDKDIKHIKMETFTEECI